MALQVSIAKPGPRAARLGWIVVFVLGSALAAMYRADGPYRGVRWPAVLVWLLVRRRGPLALVATAPPPGARGPGTATAASPSVRSSGGTRNPAKKFWLPE